jgi:hypothetical protein
MRYKNRLGGHTNSYHTYSLEEALEGIAAAGFNFVELSAVRGWTEHIPLEADAKTLGGIQRGREGRASMRERASSSRVSCKRRTTRPVRKACPHQSRRRPVT